MIRIPFSRWVDGDQMIGATGWYEHNANGSYDHRDDSGHNLWKLRLQHVQGRLYSCYSARDFLLIQNATTTWKEQQKMDVLHKVYHRRPSPYTPLDLIIFAYK